MLLFPLTDGLFPLKSGLPYDFTCLIKCRGRDVLGIQGKIITNFLGSTKPILNILLSAHPCGSQLHWRSATLKPPWCMKHKPHEESLEGEIPCGGRRDKDGDGDRDRDKDRDVERHQGALRLRHVNETAIMEENPEAAILPATTPFTNFWPLKL